jgi:Possible tRNA binding domain
MLGGVQAYCNNVVDHHLILDLAPSLAAAFFRGALAATQTPGQAAVLLLLGLQRRELAAAATALELPATQVRVADLDFCIAADFAYSLFQSLVSHCCSKRMSTIMAIAALALCCITSGWVSWKAECTMQVLALFAKSLKRFVALLKKSKEGEIERTLPRVDAAKVCCFHLWYCI